jgi:hypothetical protein
MAVAAFGESKMMAGPAMSRNPPTVDQYFNSSDLHNDPSKHTANVYLWCPGMSSQAVVVWLAVRWPEVSCIIAAFAELGTSEISAVASLPCNHQHRSKPVHASVIPPCLGFSHFGYQPTRFSRSLQLSIKLRRIIGGDGANGRAGNTP